VACKDWNDIKDEYVEWRKVTSLEWGTYPEIFLTYLSLSCSHCESPACARACPVSAIVKRGKDGIVIVESEKCLGNSACEIRCKKACPYGVPQFAGEQGAKMQMCNFCQDRVAAHKKPVCVEACPMRALDAGPLDEIEARYGNVRNAEGFVYSKKTRPSLIINPRYNR
jgi:anaerobic dimethyl sulfoxide reductase subunit B (iron-sulfur subunit)